MERGFQPRVFGVVALVAQDHVERDGFRIRCGELFQCRGQDRTNAAHAALCAERFFIDGDHNGLRLPAGHRRHARQRVVSVIIDARSQPPGERPGDETPGQHGNVGQIAFERSTAHSEQVYEGLHRESGNLMWRVGREAS